MAEITLIQGVNQALAYEMAHDQSVVVLGEDVGVNGGVFRATVGLQEKFGAQRVIDTPLAESMIAGLAIGIFEIYRDCVGTSSVHLDYKGYLHTSR